MADEKTPDKSSDESKELMKKATEAIEYLQKRNESLERRVALLAKRSGTRVRKDVPPKDIDGKTEAKELESTTDEEEMNYPSKESSTKGATDTTSTEGAFTKADLDKLLDEKFKELLEKKVPEVVKASTPIPFGWTQGSLDFKNDMAAFINKAVAVDLKNGKTETGRYDTDRLIQKSLGMVN